MNRSLKVLVVAVLMLSVSLSFGTALAKQGNKNPGQQAGQTSGKKPGVVETITLTLADKQGNPVALDAISGEYAVVTGHRYLAKATDTAKAALRWKSSKPSVVSVSNKGALYCNKPGKAVITVSNKKGSVKQSITINVLANVATFTTSQDKGVTRIYLKGSSLMMDVYLINPSSETAMTAAPALSFFLKYGDGAYIPQGVKSGRLKSEIPAGGNGIASYRVGRVDPKTINLLNASAYCQQP